MSPIMYFTLLFELQIIYLVAGIVRWVLPVAGNGMFSLYPKKATFPVERFVPTQLLVPCSVNPSLRNRVKLEA
jgi:hypothetical protein